MENRKLQRINSDIYRIISVAISTKLNNKDINSVSILEVATSGDLSGAKVFVSIEGSAEEQQKVMSALESAGGFLRTEIAQTLNLKNTPKLKFILDRGRENADRVAELLEQIKHGGAK
jgi:ribosome-binding factor A